MQNLSKFTNIILLCIGVIFLTLFNLKMLEKVDLSLSGIYSKLKQPKPSVQAEPVRYDKECNCRKLKVSNATVESKCSDAATDRGPNQRVLSFCMYQSVHPVYIRYLNFTLHYLPEFYPDGYSVRVYHEFGPDHPDREKLCDMFCSYDKLDICDINQLKIENVDLPKAFGMIWRFIPMADDLVSEWHSRDLDSRISQRESDAVNDWLISKKTYHIMRDSPYHVTNILGGMFGMRLTDENKPKMKEVLVQMLEGSYNGRKGTDQSLLSRYLWKTAEPDSVIHDSYLCQRYPSQNSRPYPTQRGSGIGVKWNFVGSNGGWIDKPCPLECRPEDHKDWEFC